MPVEDKKHPLETYNAAAAKRADAERAQRLDRAMHERAIAVEIAANPGRVHEFLPREITPGLAEAAMVELALHAQFERDAIARLARAIEVVDLTGTRLPKAAERKAMALAVLRYAQEQVPEEPVFCLCAVSCDCASRRRA